MSDWQQTPTGPVPDAPRSPYPTGPPPGPFASAGPSTTPGAPGPPGATPPPDRSNTPVLAFVIGVVVALAIAGVVLALVLVTSSDDGGGDGEQTATTASAPADGDRDGSASGAGETGSGGPAARLAIADVAASSTAPPGEEADGSSVSYAADQTVDGDRSTAWRCVGDCTGQTLTIDLGGERRVTEVGLLPGYAKTDPTDGTNRYFQNRRVSSVQWTFDDGTSVEQTFDTDDAQVQGIDLDATTREITILITGTTPPGSRDFTPISEIHVYGS